MNGALSRRTHLSGVPQRVTSNRPPAGTIDGYHLRSWTEDGFQLVAISNLNESELDEFVQRWRAS